MIIYIDSVSIELLNISCVVCELCTLIVSNGRHGKPPVDIDLFV